MKVVFRTNLGSIDAKKFKLDHTKCQVGKSVDVNKDVAEELIKMGVAETPDKAEDDEIVQSAVEEQERREAPKDTKETSKPATKEPSNFGQNPHGTTKKDS